MVGRAQRRTIIRCGNFLDHKVVPDEVGEGWILSSETRSTSSKPCGENVEHIYARPHWRIHKRQAWAARHQHSMMLTAKPPREVSLYFVFISAPVCIIVLMTESRDT